MTIWRLPSRTYTSSRRDADLLAKRFSVDLVMAQRPYRAASRVVGTALPQLSPGQRTGASPEAGASMTVAPARGTGERGAGWGRVAALVGSQPRL